MKDEEFRGDLLASAAARAESHETSIREGFTSEVLERLRDAGEVPDAETCAEAIVGQRGRKLEVDAFAFDDADDSLHLFLTMRDGGGSPPAITLTEARDQGFNRLLGVFEQARDGWLTRHIEESRPLWALARRIHVDGRPCALRLHVLTDRPMSERLREIKGDKSREGVAVTFQIWDVNRLKRIHEAHSVRDDLFVDLSELPGGGLPALPAPTNGGDYQAYLTVIPGATLADIYIEHGSRLLEGNVRTYLGRRGKINRGIATTLANEPTRFFAYNNGIAATASDITVLESASGAVLVTGIADLQIVNGAQTTASLAALRRERKMPESEVAVPMKLSVVAPAVAEGLIPKISRYANMQNAVRASDFFANHAFHRRIEEMSRRILAPAQGNALTQTHWYYERARGQHLNDQAGLTAAKKEQFLRRNPRSQVITKTDLAKVETCFAFLPDIACKGAEKAFVTFAERITKEWKDESRRSAYGDDWYRGAVARMILFRTTEGLVSRAPWYEGGYRAQIVAYATARLAALAKARSDGGRLDYMKVWSAQRAGDVLERQLLAVAENMMRVLRDPPLAGQNISEWAKQQACREKALGTDVPVAAGFDAFLLAREDVRSEKRDDQQNQRVAEGLDAVVEVMDGGPALWAAIRDYARANRLITSGDEGLLTVACAVPNKVPQDWQATRLMEIRRRCEDAGFRL